MVANLENIQKIYSEIPNTFIVEGVRIDNYRQSNDHFEHGWREVVIPEITHLQKLSDEFILVGDIVTKEVIDFTQEEIEVYNNSLIPQELHRMKIFLELADRGITRSYLKTIINASELLTELEKNRIIVKIDTAQTFKIDDENLVLLAPIVGITDLPEFFISASQQQ